MNYEKLNYITQKGWNTYNSESVLSYVYMPYGFSISLILKDFSSDAILRAAKVGRKENNEEHIIPGLRSYDGMYTELTVDFLETRFKIQTTSDDTDQIILVTPVSNGRKTPAINVEISILWGNDGTVGKESGKIFGILPDGKRIDVWSTLPTYTLPYTYSTSPYFTVDMTETFAISTKEISVTKAEKLVKLKRQKLLSEIAGKYAPHTQAYTAMSCCLAWDTIYEEESKRLCSTVSRIWNKAWGGYVLFDWDTFFAAVMASLDNKELAYLNAIAIVDEVTEKGFIPNFASNNNFKSRDRSQPPVGSMAVMDIYDRYGDKWLLDRVYPTLIRQNRWFWENRTIDGGYLCWGSNLYEPITGRYWEMNNLSCRYGGSLESGLDNSPMYDEARFNIETELLELADVGLMGLYIGDCEALIRMAEILGKEEDLPELTKRRNAVSKALDTMWDEECGMYLNRDIVTGTLSTRVSPTNFYALYDTAVGHARKRKMLDNYFYNPDKFWGEFIMPSITRDDPAYKDNDYWRGRIWAPLNYLVYCALLKAGLTEDAGILAAKSENLLMKEWNLHGHVHENYNADTGIGCDVMNSDGFYHWGGLLGYIAIDYEKYAK